MYLLCFRHSLKPLSCVLPEFKDLLYRVDFFFLFWEEIATPLPQKNSWDRAGHGLSRGSGSLFPEEDGVLRGTG